MLSSGKSIGIFYALAPLPNCYQLKICADLGLTYFLLIPPCIALAHFDDDDTKCLGSKSQELKDLLKCLSFRYYLAAPTSASKDCLILFNPNHSISTSGFQLLIRG